MKKQIFLIDLTHETPLGLASDSMPLQLGLIASYVLDKMNDIVDIHIFKFLDDLEGAIKVREPFVLGVSNFQWNIELSYNVAQIIKEKYPSVVVVFGGPNYPDSFDEQVSWLRKYKDVDFYIYKDGEIPFYKLLVKLVSESDLKNVKMDRIPSCHAIYDNVPYFGEIEERIKDLSLVASPYTTGILDKFFKNKIIPSMQTNRGCPFSCTFCTEGEKYYSKVNKTSLDRKKEEFDYIVSHVDETDILRITDSNFGMYKEDEDFCEYIGKVQKKTGYPAYLTCSAGKNNQDRLLRCNKLIGGAMRLTASVQSLDGNVLENVKRKNISINDIVGLSDKVSDTDTHSYSEIILALPGDSLKAQENSFSGLMGAGISNITQHQLSMIYGTEMSSADSREKYGLKTMFRPLQRAISKCTFLGKELNVVEIEEVCVSSKTLSFEDYLKSRALYLTVGLFYNDRIFGEINALLRILKLPTFGWIKLIHDDIDNLNHSVRELYNSFLNETENELFKDRDKLKSHVIPNIEKYSSGEGAGNLIYKYRTLSYVKHFEIISEIAFKYLNIYLVNNNVINQTIVENIKNYSFFKKNNFIDLNFDRESSFDYDVYKLVHDVEYARSGGTLEGLKYKTSLRFRHSNSQRDIINKQLDFYGHSVSGITLLISRFPVKKLFRKVEYVV